MVLRTLAWIALLGGVAPLGGCSVCRTAHRVTIEEPRQYCESKDEEASLATYRSMADRAWAEAGACCPDTCLAGDYAWGFREGFAQYVYAGGDGQPPAVPPRPYWQLDLRNQEGAKAVRSWFQGYRHGAQVARDGGYRETATLVVSASLRDCDECGCPDEGGAAIDSCPTCPIRPVPPAASLPTAEPPFPSGPSFESPERAPAELVLPTPAEIAPEPVPANPTPEPTPAPLAPPIEEDLFEATYPRADYSQADGPQLGYPLASNSMPGHPLADVSTTDVPEADTQEANYPLAGYSLADSPAADEPKAGVPGVDHSLAGYPQADSRAVDEPKAGTPEVNHPLAGYPQAETPEAVSPEAEKPAPEATPVSSEAGRGRPDQAIFRFVR